jgi:proline iminopeptidase
MVFGGSWGSTLALAYAETHPERVTEMILWGTAMTRPSEIDWLYRGVAPLFPAQWAKFIQGVPEAERGDDLVEAYDRLLNDPNLDIRTQAAASFHEWEWALFSVDGDAQPGERWLDPHFQLTRARIITHYFRNRAWLEDGQLLKDAGRLAGIPGVMVHGRLDMGSPLKAAWELAQVWKVSQLIVVPGAGHSTSDPGIDEALVAATERFGS